MSRKRALAMMMALLMVCIYVQPLMAEDGAKVNINTATAEQLTQLKGIGPKTAEKIIAYRSQNPFKKIEELTQVSGIGEKLFESIKDQISVE